MANWQYDDVSKVLAPLKGPRNDLQVLREALTHNTLGLFRPEDVKVLENLPFKEMQEEFLQFLRDARREDHLLLYFSGHGERLSGERLALCGVDTKYTLLDATSFDTTKLRSWIEDDNRAPSTIVILDCCYAGQMKGTLSEQTLVRSFGAGTMVLASGANQPAQDAMSEGEPSPFTAALTKILLDPGVPADRDEYLTADAAYHALEQLQPPLLPKPYRNIQSQGTFALAKRELPAAPRRPELKGFQPLERVDVVDLTFGGETVAARWGTGESETLELTALDYHRQSAVRRLGQLADAVIRVPEYADDLWWQQAVQRAWNCVGANLFETALPPMLRQRIRSRIDGPGRDVLKVRLAFEREGSLLEPYPWEYLQFGRTPGVAPAGDEEALPLAMRSGLLIERVAGAERPTPSDLRPADAAPTVGLVNCLHDGFAAAAARIADGLTKMADLNVIIDLQGRKAGWGNLLDAVDQRPKLLLLFAPVRRRAQGVEVGFTVDNPAEPDWHLARELSDELRNTGLRFDVIVVVTFAAKPGQDSFRGTFELARVLAGADIGPIVFVCHARGYETHVPELGQDTFPVLLIDTLTRGKPLDQAFYYAKNRVMRGGSAALRRTFGVAGYYTKVLPEPRPTRPSPIVSGGQRTAPETGGSPAKESTGAP